MTAFFNERRPSAGVYFTSPVCSREEQLTMASMGALFLGSPPPRWITGSPFSRSMAAVSFSFRVGDSDMDLASWLKLMDVSQTSLDTRIPGCATGLGIRSTTVYKISWAKILGGGGDLRTIEPQAPESTGSGVCYASQPRSLVRWPRRRSPDRRTGS